MHTLPKIFSPARIEKTWGYELWIHNSHDYCGKLLVFEQVGSSFSMHYHVDKKESWYVQQGGFNLELIVTDAGRKYTQLFNQGESINITPGLPHKLTALYDNSIIFEVSTHHKDSDSYRIYRDSPIDLLE